LPAASYFPDKSVKILIAGAGEVGTNLIESLYRDHPDIHVIDMDGSILEKIHTQYNVKVTQGNVVDPGIYAQVEADQVDLFLAITSVDETNMIACKTAKEAGVAKTICRIRQIDLTSSKRAGTLDALGIDVVINPVRLVAEELKQVALAPNLVEIHPFLQGRLQLIGYRIQPDCPLVGKTCETLAEKLNPLQIELGFILRSERTIVPTRQKKIQAKDQLFFLLEPQRHEALVRYLGYLEQPKLAKRIFINGGGHIGVRLARMLEQEGCLVKVIELSKERAFRITERLEKSLVLNFDGTDQEQLLAEGIEAASHFFSVTDVEEVNITACLLAAKIGVPRTLALVKQPEMISILENATPISLALSPRLITARYLSRFIKGSAVESYFSHGQLELMEMHITASAVCVGHPLKALKCPEDLRILMVFRQEAFFLPHAETKLEEGDSVILVFHHLDRRKATALFAPLGEA